MTRYRDALAIFGLALGLRLVFSLLMSNTYDVDEFVYLALGRDAAHGAVPYRDFPFFHPPGILVLLKLVNPLTTLWWPLARLMDVVIDSGTTVLVWRVGLHLYGRRGALAAGVLYAANPLVLVSAVRIDQETIMTALSMMAITLLLTRRSYGAAALAGACIGAACWVKYPMAAFLPAYLILAARRAPACLVGFLGATIALFAPFLPEAHQLYNDTVMWQIGGRQQAPLGLRLFLTGAFWLAINPCAVLALTRRRVPLWLAAGFATGGIFLFTSTVYPHYFVSVAAFAAVLGAPVACKRIRIPIRAVVAGCIAVALAWAAGISMLATDRGFGLASRFSDTRPIIRTVERWTPAGTPILVSSFEYAYLAGRPWIDHYFWDDHTVVSASHLDHGLTPNSMVVQDPQSDQLAYPRGLTSYLNAHYKRVAVHGAVIWLIGRRAAPPIAGRPPSLSRLADADAVADRIHGETEHPH